MATKISIGMSADDIRPAFFDGVIGNADIVTPLTNSISSGHIPRVVFFTGATGAGKTTLARILARSILCENRPPGSFEPCDNCDSCHRSIAEFVGNHIDYDERGAADIDKDWLDDLKFVVARPWTVVFIDELQDIRHEYVKRMRKIVEQVRGVMIFATTHRDKIEAAFLSRLCSYEYRLRRPKTLEVVDYFKRRFQEWELTYQNEQQLVRVANALRCEMRPCGEFPRKVLAETNGTLTDGYLDHLFGPESPSAGGNSTAEWDPNPTY